MNKFFVPYANETPAAIDIKGHKVLILTSSYATMMNDLGALGGTSFRELNFMDNQTQVLGELAASMKAGVVLAPPGVSIPTMIYSLEQQLPWVH